MSTHVTLADSATPLKTVPPAPERAPNKVYALDVQPTTRGELAQAWEQWGHEKKFFEPVRALRQALHQALENEGFVVAAKVYDVFQVSKNIGALYVWSQSQIQHPQAQTPFTALVSAGFYEDGRAMVAVDFTPVDDAKDLPPSGLHHRKAFEFQISQPVGNLRPEEWAQHARDVCSRCFDSQVSVPGLLGGDPVAPLGRVLNHVVEELCNYMSA